MPSIPSATDVYKRQIMDHLTSSLEKTSQDIDRFSSAVDLLIETAQSAQELTAAAQALLPDTDSTIQDSLTALGSLRALTDACLLYTSRCV